MITPITLVTPVSNRGDLTDNYLSQHWARYQNRPEIHWHIIDNGSIDHTQHVLRRWQAIMGQRLIVLRNGKNEGFPRPCNQGAEHVHTGLLVFINNDVELRGDYLTRIKIALDTNEQALVGAQLLDRPTGWNLFGGTLVTYLAGWCLAMRAEVFHALGGFDERYSPCDYEDMDFCHAAQQAGHELVALELPLFHISEQTAITVLKDRRSITERNRLKFAEKWRLEV